MTPIMTAKTTKKPPMKGPCRTASAKANTISATNKGIQIMKNILTIRPQRS
jgi:hypothetical protein